MHHYYVTHADGRPVLPGDRVGGSGATPGAPLLYADADPTLVYVYAEGADPANATPMPPAVLGLRILRPDFTEWPPPANAGAIPPRGRDGEPDDRYAVWAVANSGTGDRVATFDGTPIGGAGGSGSSQVAWLVASRHAMAALYREHVGAS